MTVAIFYEIGIRRFECIWHGEKAMRPPDDDSRKRSYPASPTARLRCDPAPPTGARER
ncbi:MAG: hypothetical protein F6K22_12605 [Okeania sp. SIO2F4]|uniref:hypothetical protein n=1 Tax=Okeania sp. SIO2F4 TaxID=2607790 RepID=UPI00142AD4C6|nr:hypothetical protein [Okeania sp. SIO2F4]NES03609.1 hypothetical protein [Okeania sp. SIO2F4]